MIRPRNPLEVTRHVRPTCQFLGMRRQPLPHQLLPVFTAADAAASGVSRSRLRAGDLIRPFRGVYTPLDDRRAALAPAEGIIDRARLAQPRLGDGAFFSHLTAAVIWEIPLPLGCLLSHHDLDVGVLHPARPPRVEGLRGHRVQPQHVRTMVHPDHRLPVPSPASTWAMLGSVLTHPYDLVAAADAIISDRRFEANGSLASLAQLEAAVCSKRRVGIRALRDALERVRPHVASRTETWTRLVLVDAGLPQPQINYSVYDDNGRFLACVDLAYPQWRIAIEYEGAHHLFNETQWTNDIDRYERLAAAGWHVIRVRRMSCSGIPRGSSPVYAAPSAPPPDLARRPVRRRPVRRAPPPRPAAAPFECHLWRMRGAGTVRE